MDPFGFIGVAPRYIPAGAVSEAELAGIRLSCTSTPTSVCWLFIFKVTEPNSIPYRTHPACAKRAAYPDPPPVILLPESIAAQAAYQLRYKNTEYYSWVSSGPKCFQVLGLSPSLL